MDNAVFSVFTLDLPTSRASKVELGARKIYTMQAKTEREARRVYLHTAKDFENEKVYIHPQNNDANIIYIFLLACCKKKITAVSWPLDLSLIS